MEADGVLNLFDGLWFHAQILQNRSNKPSTILSTPLINPDPELIQPKAPIVPELIQPKAPIVPELIQPKAPIVCSSQLSRSKSDEVFYLSSPDSVLKPHLQTIFSDREISVEIPKPRKKVVNTKRKRLSKSLSELEFEEVKGFMDLGFVFSEEDKDSRLVEIIPGLQRLGQSKEEITTTAEEEEEEETRRMRPYLSEAWENLLYGKNEEKLAPLMMDWTSNEIDMKDSLKCWAHSVASAVR